MAIMRLVDARTVSPRVWLGMLMVLALAHGGLYALIVPIWQAPDEPMLFEYAGLIAELGRIPGQSDRSARLEERIVRSQGRQQFWTYLTGHTPARLPQTLDESLALVWMPRQVGGDPPLYFVLASLLLRFARNWTIEQQVLLLRLCNALLLPGVVACAYGAAREVIGDRPSIALGVAGLVALQPMFVVSSTSVSNDGLANLLGAALCWMLLRMLRRGMSLNRLVLTLALLTAALLTKRTPLVYLVALVGVVFVVGRRTSPRYGRMRQVWHNGALLVMVAMPIVAWSTLQFDSRMAGAWLDARTEQPAQRIEQPDDSGAVLLVRAGEEVIQPLPPVGIHALRNQVFRYGVKIEGPGDARGRLMIYSGAERHEFPFEIHGEGMPQAQIVVPPAASSLRVGLTADDGWFYADNFWATGGKLQGNLLVNGTLDLPAIRPSLLHSIARYLRVPDLVWAVHTGRPFSTFSYIAWARLLFASFWGYFGWMSVPFVLGSFWMPVLSLCSLAGLAGSLRFVLRAKGEPRQRRQIGMLLLLVLLALGLILVNAYAEPSGLQQGRYLFPVLVPIALLLVVGQWSLVPARWRAYWLAGWFGFWSVFAGAALACVRAYYP